MDTATTSAYNWSSSLWLGVTAGLQRFMVAIPTVLGALFILLIGWFLSGVLGRLATTLFRTLHVDTLAERIKVTDFLQKAGTRLKASAILGLTLKWVTFLVFITMATNQLGLPQVTEIVNRMLAYIPNILVAMLVLGLGAFLAQLVAGVVRGTASEARVNNPQMLAKLASGAVMAFAIIAAVNQLGIAPVVVNTLYIGLVAALALALGLAFGLGGRETAARLTEQWVNQAHESAQGRQERASAPSINSADGHGALPARSFAPPSAPQ